MATGVPGLLCPRRSLGSPGWPWVAVGVPGQPWVDPVDLSGTAMNTQLCYPSHVQVQGIPRTQLDSRSRGQQDRTIWAGRTGQCRPICLVPTAVRLFIVDSRVVRLRYSCPQPCFLRSQTDPESRLQQCQVGSSTSMWPICRKLGLLGPCRLYHPRFLASRSGPAGACLCPTPCPERGGQWH